MRASTLVIALALAGCTSNPPAMDNGDSQGVPGTGPSSSQQADWKAIEQMEAEAKAIADARGCSLSADCRSAPVGSRGCGGPRYYLPYCARTTDSVALYRKLDEIARAEQVYNKRYGVVSTCEFRMPPLVEASGGVCTAR